MCYCQIYIPVKLDFHQSSIDSSYTYNVHVQKLKFNFTYKYLDPGYTRVFEIEKKHIIHLSYKQRWLTLNLINLSKKRKR